MEVFSDEISLDNLFDEQDYAVTGDGLPTEDILLAGLEQICYRMLIIIGVTDTQYSILSYNTDCIVCQPCKPVGWLAHAADYAGGTMGQSMQHPLLASLPARAQMWLIVSRHL